MPAPARVCSWDSDSHPTLNLWTTGNVEEVIPGVPTPLVASMFQWADWLTTKGIVEGYGVDDLIPPLPPPVANWVGIFAGRGALNLGWFGAIFATFQVGEGSGALEQYFSSDKENLQTGASADTVRAAATRRLLTRYVWPATPVAIQRWNKRVAALKVEQAAMDLPALSDAALYRYFRRLWNTSATVLTRHLFIAAAAGEMLADTGKFLEAELGDAYDPNSGAALTTGLGEIESARPGFELWRIGRYVAAKPALAAEVARMDAHHIAAALAKPADAGWRAFAQRVDAFIAEFGFRGQSEADPTVPTWDEDRTFVLSVIKTNAGAGKEQDPIRRAKTGETAREALEAGIESRLRRGARGQFRLLAGRAQHFARSRERSKAAWVRSIRLVRPPLLEMADRCARRGLVAGPGDFSYLLLDEVEAIFAGKGASDYRAAVAARKAEHARMMTLLPPEVYAAPPEVAPIEAPAASAGKSLSGNGVSVGVASGRARVIRSAAAAEEADLVAGEVLVAPFTDAAWTPLFMSAAAVVVETGGMLSHAATVAREYGIPAVVAVRGATSFIKDGETVTVDGTAGVVTIA
ncbi:MAG: hypothetical protein HY875_17695 [Chloroflexi bacterium]|nr:hypothetical protein [Chloroflexota bacterium]